MNIAIAEEAELIKVNEYFNIIYDDTGEIGARKLCVTATDSTIAKDAVMKLVETCWSNYL